MKDLAEIHPETIKPAARGEADFFSWKLYLWVKKKPHATQIWRGTWNHVSGFDPNRPILYIGRMDGHWMHGKALRALCRKGQSISALVYGPGHDTPNWVDITDEWWSEYRRIGVCAIHGDLAHKWDESERRRVCRYCGKHETKVTKLVERTQWVEVPE